MSLLGGMLYWLVWNWVLWGAIHFFGKIWPEIKGVAYTIGKKGVVIHELFHYLVMKLLFMKVAVSNIHIENGSGRVAFPKTGHESPLKIFLVAIAPWICGTLLINYAYAFFSGFAPTHLIGSLFVFLAKYALIGAIVLTLPPSFEDLRLISRTILDRFPVFLKQLMLIFLAFAAYMGNFFGIITFRDWLFGLSFEHFKIAEYILRPLAESYCILILFGLFDLILFLFSWLFKIIYNKMRYNSKLEVKPTNYLGLLGDEFITNEIVERPRISHATDTDMTPIRSDLKIRQLLKAEMANGLPSPTKEQEGVVHGN